VNEVRLSQQAQQAQLGPGFAAYEPVALVLLVSTLGLSICSILLHDTILL
jgi:hypothetical protein